MADFPRNLIAPPLIHTFSRYGPGTQLRALAGAAPAAQTWVANVASYVPICLPWPYYVRRLFWINGSIVGGFSDIGIYSVGGGRLYNAGSTANTGALSAPQYVTADILLGPGVYFLAYTNDGTSSRVYGITPSATIGRLAGLYQQATALPLPALATFAAYSNVPVPWIGISNVPSGF